jgi:ATP-dependent DNA helicase PIF1
MRCRFSKYLLTIGDGLVLNPVTIEEEMLMAPDRRTVGHLISDIYGDLASFPIRAATMAQHAIVTPKNKDVTTLNDDIIDRFPGEATDYHAKDVPVDIDDEGKYDPDFYAMQNPKGLPPTVLRLKVGMPVMLLRNLDPSGGLANGTRLTITKLQPYLIHAKILTGANVGEEVLLPRISIRTDEQESLSVHFSRRQYPLKPAFAMTINKAQGQTLKRIGVYLPAPVFSHGQLYVAMSRAGAAKHVRMLLDDVYEQTSVSTQNVVYRELLTDA